MIDDQPRLWISRYYASFNGLRALAVTGVFVMHFGSYASPKYLSGGLWWAGVDLFFVISGFLITGILYSSRQSPTYFRDFYIRRFLRIIPLYWGLLTALWLFALEQGISHPYTLLYNYVFIQNFFYRRIGMGMMPIGPTALAWQHGTIGLGVFWSLCVEEQFYLVWPFVVRLFPSRDMLLRISLAGVGLVLALRCFLFFFDRAAAEKTLYLYMLPFTRFDGLLLGAALNLWLQKQRLSRRSLRNYSTTLFFAGSVSLCVALAFSRKPMNLFNPVVQTASYTLFAIAFAGIVMRSLDESSRLSRILRWKALVSLGTVSYGFYLMHDIFTSTFARLVARVTGVATLFAVAAYFFLIYGLAQASFRLWESPFLSLKDRLAPSHKSVPAVTPPVTVS